MAVGTESGTAWLQSLSRFGIKPGLQRTKRVLDALGNPQRGLQFFHVAGTNGKGSVCAALTSLLSANHSVGTFTSPSFDGYRGRFVVDGEPIPVNDFEELAEQVRDATAHVTPDDPLTEFEVLTVMALLYFKARNVQAVVWETGLGGRYDSTNVVEPCVTAITNVGYDHVEILGPTLRDIARDKAGIAKPGIPVFTAATEEAREVIQAVATSVGAPVYVHGIDFAATRIAMDGVVQRMAFRGLNRDWFDVPVPLFGAHQIENAGIALAMYESAVARGLVDELDAAALRKAMRSIQWSGRFEMVEWNHKTVVLDGAHNPEGARRLADALTELRQAVPSDCPKWTMVIGILRDKQIEKMLRAVLPHAARVIVTRPETERATNTEELSNWIKACRNDIEVSVVSSVEDAMVRAAEYENDICCWGSLYTVHEARNAMNQSAELWKQGR